MDTSSATNTTTDKASPKRPLESNMSDERNDYDAHYSNDKCWHVLL